MKKVAFDGSFSGWRRSARYLLAREVPPEAIEFIANDNEQDSLIADEITDVGDVKASVRVPKEFIDAAPDVACFRNDAKWIVMYRILWRLTHGERSLLLVTVDNDVHRFFAMKRAIARDVHKMHAFVRFRRIEDSDGEQYVAWFRPRHLIVERATPFFAKRFASMKWSILTPDRSAHWNGETLEFGEGIPRSQAPRADELDSLWKTYYASIFNPARVRPATMQREMPRRYWENLPEASVIPELIRDAPARVRRMIDRA